MKCFKMTQEMLSQLSRGALETDPFCVIASVIEMTESASDHDPDLSQSGPSHHCLRCQETTC